MADEIVLKLVLESDLANKSVGELKQDFKDLTQQLNNTTVGTKEYKDTLQSLGVVKGGLQDLKQQIIALNPERQIASIARLGSTVASGFAAAQGAAALFGSQSEDLMKVLVRVQAATALASGLQGLAGMAKALQTARMAMIAFAMSNPFTAILAGVTLLAGAIYGIVKALDDTNKKVDDLTSSNDLLASSFKNIGDESDLMIRRLKANDAAAGVIFGAEQKRRKDELANLKQRLKNLQDIWELEKDFTQEQSDEFDKINAEIILKEKELGVAKDEFRKQQRDKLKAEEKQEEKEAEKKKEADKKSREEKEAEEKRVHDFALKLTLDGMSARNLAEEKDFEDKKARERKEADEIMSMNQANDELTRQVLADDLQRKLLLEKQFQDAKLSIIQSGVSSLNSLGETIIKNDRKLAQFKKAVALVEIGIDTALAISNLNAESAKVSAQMAGILGPATPIFTISYYAAGIARILANVAKATAILNAPLPAGISGGGGGGGGSAPSLESPQGQTFKVNATNIKTDEEGMFQGFNKEQSPLRAYVVETDITSKQKNIQRIENNSKF